MKRIAVLASIIIFSLFTFSSIAQMPDDDFDMPGKHHFMMMAEKLNLTEEQKDAIAKLRTEHQRKMIDLKADLQKAKLELKELKQNGNYTRDDFITKVKAISDIKNKIAIAMANHRMDVYELLTNEQKKTFDKLPMGLKHKPKMMNKHKMMKKHKMMDRD